jgi:arsenate reductase
MSITVYHNPRCTKSREAVKYLEEKGVDIEIREYLKDSFSENELDDVLQKLGMQPEELLRKNEAIFKEQFKGKTLSRTEWIKKMIAFPKLIERPIVVKEDKAVVARPAEKIDELL